jgi:hypothetical protein
VIDPADIAGIADEDLAVAARAMKARREGAFDALGDDEWRVAARVLRTVRQNRGLRESPLWNQPASVTPSADAMRGIAATARTPATSTDAPWRAQVVNADELRAFYGGTMTGDPSDTGDRAGVVAARADLPEEEARRLIVRMRDLPVGGTAVGLEGGDTGGRLRQDVATREYLERAGTGPVGVGGAFVGRLADSTIGQASNAVRSGIATGRELAGRLVETIDPATGQAMRTDAMLARAQAEAVRAANQARPEGTAAEVAGVAGDLTGYIATLGSMPFKAAAATLGLGNYADLLTEYRAELQRRGDPNAETKARLAAGAVAPIQTTLDILPAERMIARIASADPGFGAFVQRRLLDAAYEGLASAGSDAAVQAGGLAIGSQDRFDAGRTATAAGMGAAAAGTLGAGLDAVARLTGSSRGGPTEQALAQTMYEPGVRTTPDAAPTPTPTPTRQTIQPPPAAPARTDVQRPATASNGQQAADAPSIDRLMAEAEARLRAREVARQEERQTREPSGPADEIGRVAIGLARPQPREAPGRVVDEPTPVRAVETGVPPVVEPNRVETRPQPGDVADQVSPATTARQAATPDAGRVGPPPPEVANPPTVEAPPVRQPATPDAPAVTPDAPPSRLESTIDNIRQAAEKRIAQRAQTLAKARAKGGKRGRLGAAGALDPADLIDRVIVLAAKATKAGVRKGRKLFEMARQLAPDERQARVIARQARRIITNATDAAGVIDDARFEVETYKLQRRAARRDGASTKAQIREATGQTPNEPDTITQREALRGSLAAEERGARAATRAARQSAEIQAGLARIELSKAGKRARAAMIEERRKGRAALAAAKLDAARTLKAAMAVAKDNRAEVRAMLMDLPAGVRGRSDMIALLDRATSAKDATAASEVVLRELHRQSVRDNLAALRGIRARRKAVPRDLKTVLDTAIAKLETDLRRLKREWTVREALSGAKKGEPIAVRADVDLADSGQIATNAAERADEVRAAIQAAVNARKVRIGERNATTSYVRKNVAGRVSQIPPTAKQAKVGQDRAWNTRAIRRWSMLGWTPKTLFKAIDGTLGSDAIGYAETLAVRQPILAEREVQREIQQVRDSLEKIATDAGYTSIDDLYDRWASTRVKLPWDPNGQTVSIGEALYMLGQDAETMSLLNAGARLQLASLGDGGKPFAYDSGKADALRSVVSDKDMAAYEAMKGVYETFRPRIKQVMEDETGTSAPDVDGYQPRATIEQHALDTDGKTSLTLAEYVRQERLENASFTKERQASTRAVFAVRNPIDVLLSHTARAAKLIHLTRVVRDAEAVFKDPEVRRQIARTMGETTLEHIDRHLEQITLLPKGGQNTLDRIGSGLTRNVGRGMTQINPGTWLRQYGSMTLVLHDFGPAETTRAMAAATQRSAMREMIESNPALRARYEGDAPIASLMGVAGGRDASAKPGAGGKARGLIDTKKGRVALRRMLRGFGSLGRGGLAELREGNDALWNSIRLHNLTDAQVVTMVYSIQKRAVRKEHPEWTDAKVREEAGTRTADWVDDRANTSSTNTLGLFQKSIADRGALSAVALFSSDRTKLFNLWLDARARDGGKFGKHSLKALAAITANSVWGQLAGRIYRNLALGSIGAAIYGAGMENEEEKDKALIDFGVGVAQDVVGIVPGGAFIKNLTDSARGAYGGGQSAMENPVTSTADDLFRAVASFTREVYAAIAPGEETGEDPKAADFLRAERAIRRRWRILSKATDGAMTMAGVPLAGLRRDVMRVATPAAEDMDRAARLLTDGNDGGYAKAQNLIRARFDRMVAFGVDPDRVRANLAGALARALNTNVTDEAEKKNNIAEAETVVNSATQ